MTACRLLLFCLTLAFLVLVLPVSAQQVIATVPAGASPYTEALNPTTNKIYVANFCATCAYPNNQGTVTVVDGTTDNTLSVNVGYYPYGVAVNPVTNKIYVANECGNDPNCGTHSGTVSVIDGVSNTVIATVTVGSDPYAVAVNSVTNKIYVANYCGNDITCGTFSGTVSVINGVSNMVTATVLAGTSVNQPVVNSVTNKIYVPNSCGNEPTCSSPFSDGTVTVIDGATNNPTSVNVGIFPDALDVNSATNKIYVANQCGDDPTCLSTATMTVIDGATLGTTDVPIGGFYPFTIAVNSVTNKIYVPGQCGGLPSCQGEPNGTVSVIDGGTLAYASVPSGLYSYGIAVNSVTNKIYVANQCSNSNCQIPNPTVTVIDGVTLARINVGVGSTPYAVTVNSATNRTYVSNICGNGPNCQNGTVSVIDGTPPTALQFVAVTPCRAVDTRPPTGGGPIPADTFQSFAISGAGACATLPAAAVYSLNVTVVPQGTLNYLTIWPTGQSRPMVSTLNSDGRIKANAAIVPAGAGGEVSVFVTDTANVILDVDGYFAPASSSTLAFYPLPPCRVVDTRMNNFPPGLGDPYLPGGVQRDFPVLESPCIPTGITPQAYSFNFTAVPDGTHLNYLTVWPTGESQPVVSTLNDQRGIDVANAAIVPAGTNGKISVYPTNDTNLVIDIDGYFAPPGQGGLSLYGVQPCRVIDTRQLGPPFDGTLSPPVDTVDSGCSASSLAQAYVFNATVVPVDRLGFLTLWPDGQQRPFVSTLNANDGAVTSNMAIVPAGNQGEIDAYAARLTQMILDISSYFAP